MELRRLHLSPGFTDKRCIGLCCGEVCQPVGIPIACNTATAFGTYCSAGADRCADVYKRQTYEWVAEGISREKENLQDIPPEICAHWYRMFQEGKFIVFKDLEEIRESDPLQYENLKRQNIHSLVAVSYTHLCSAGQSKICAGHFYSAGAVKGSGFRAQSCGGDHRLWKKRQKAGGKSR